MSTGLGVGVRGLSNDNVFIPYQGKLAFIGDNSQIPGTVNVWVTDGTAAGTHPVGNSLVNLSVDPVMFTASGGYLYFGHYVNTSDSYRSLYRFDGTNCTALLSQCDPGALTDLSGTLLFSRNGLDINSSYGLWALDTAGLRQIAGPIGGTGSIGVLGTAAYFCSGFSTSNTATMLWKTDGVSASVVWGDTQTTFDSPPRRFEAIGSRLYFSRCSQQPWI